MKKKSSGSFYVRTARSTSGAIRWYLYKESYLDGKKIQESIPKKLFTEFGFKKEWSVIEAKERCKRLNQEHRLQVGSHIKAAKRSEELAIYDELLLPEHLVKEFFNVIESESFGTSKHVEKLKSHFVTIQRIIKTLKLHPTDFKKKSSAIYKHFEAQKYSSDYTAKLIRSLNQWGSFFCESQGLFFHPVMAPKGIVRARIQEAQLSKKNVKRASEPLTEELLKKARLKFSDPAHFNFIAISFWFGLRPSEVENLLNPEFYRVSKEGGVQVLEVYQPKLVSLEKEKRWKFIPCFLKEQQDALRLIQSGQFKRPHSKTIKKIFGPGFGLYSGRKGFEAMMVEKGQSFEDISSWLGHTSLDTTYQRYSKRRRLSWNKISG